jgi:3-hydroxyisobutyrate dehydrogenase
MATTLGWIGTGIMGRSMCGHLLAGGHGVQITRARDRKPKT